MSTIDNIPNKYTFVCDKCGGKFYIGERSWYASEKCECIVCNYKTAYKNWRYRFILPIEYEREIKKRIGHWRDYDKIIKEHGEFKEEFLEGL